MTVKNIPLCVLQIWVFCWWSRCSLDVYNGSHHCRRVVISSCICAICRWSPSVADVGILSSWLWQSEVPCGTMLTLTIFVAWLLFASHPLVVAFILIEPASLFFLIGSVLLLLGEGVRIDNLYTCFVSFYSLPLADVIHFVSVVMLLCISRYLYYSSCFLLQWPVGWRLPRILRLCKCLSS